MYPDYYPARSRRPLIIGAVIVLVVLVLGIIGVNVLRTILSQKTVTLQATNGATVKFGYPGDSDGGPEISEVLAETNTTTTIKVKAGDYVAEFSGEGMQSQKKVYDITEDTTIESPKLAYSKERLATELQAQKPAIQQATATIPQLNGYRVALEGLYGQGDWYGAVMVPPNQQTQDVLLIILHKKNGTWQLVGQPSLTFYVGDYPDVPVQLIRDINNYQPR